MHLRRVGGAVQPVEAFDQQVVVDRRPADFAVGGDAADPMAECPLRRTAPRLVGIILADETDAVVEEDAVIPLTGPQVAAAGGAPAGRGLDLVVRHSRTAWNGRPDAGAGISPCIVSTGFRQRQALPAAAAGDEGATRRSVGIGGDSAESAIMPWLAPPRTARQGLPP